MVSRINQQLKQQLKSSLLDKPTANTSHSPTRYRIRYLLGISLCIVMFGWVRYELMHNACFAIQEVKIYADYQRVSVTQLRNAIIPFIRRGFFLMNMASLKKELVQIPWVSDVSLQRRWPHGLLIKVTTQPALAIWNDQAVIDESQRVFYPDPTTLPNDLPRLRGPNGKYIPVLDNFLSMQKQLNTVGLSIKQLEWDEHQEWNLLLQNDIVLRLGQEAIMERLTRFIKAYQKVFLLRQDQVQYVDCRYKYGLAVKFFKSVTEVKSNAQKR